MTTRGTIGRLAAMLLVLGAGAAPSLAQAQSRFSDWAGAIIAADWRTSQGQPIQAFDNARRDLTSGFLAAGFPRENLVDYSLRPDAARPVTAQQALSGVTAKAEQFRTGCFLYFSSHGSPQGIVFGPEERIDVQRMTTLIRTTCGGRPTVVIISACYSGTFLPALAAPNRMVVTAARRDRSSFGCSEEATYPYFDGCVIESLPKAANFIALANAAKACVARRETEEGLSPASEPQISIGADLQLLLPTLRFSRPPTGGETPGS